jgi:hypothetical protein
MRDTGRLTGYEQQIETVLQSELETRRRFEAVIANFQGTKLQTPYLEEDLRATEQFLVAVKAFLQWVEETSKPYLENDPLTFANQLIRNEGRLTELNLQLDTSLGAMDSASLLMQSTVKKERVELTRAKGDARRYHIKQLLQIPASLFCLVYGIFVVASVRRFVKTESTRRAKPKGTRKKRK